MTKRSDALPRERVDAALSYLRASFKTASRSTKRLRDRCMWSHANAARRMKSSSRASFSASTARRKSSGCSQTGSLLPKCAASKVSRLRSRRRTSASIRRTDRGYCCGLSFFFSGDPPCAASARSTSTNCFFGVSTSAPGGACSMNVRSCAAAPFQSCFCASTIPSR